MLKEDPRLAEALAKIAALQKELAEAKAEPKTVAEAEKPAESDNSEKFDPNRMLKEAKPLIKMFSKAMGPQRDEAVRKMITEGVKQMTAKANLTPEQAAALEAHLLAVDEENKKKWDEALNKDLSMQDLMNMGRNRRADPQNLLDDWAAANLTGEQAEKYQTSRLTEKSEKITANANERLERLNKDLGLSEAQQDQVFNILVQTDKNYDSKLQIEGAAGTQLGKDIKREEAIAAVLTPDQAAKYQTSLNQRKETEKSWGKMLGIRPEDMSQEP